MEEQRPEVLVEARDGEPAQPLTVDFGAVTATWTWDGTGFGRAHGGVVHRDGDGVPVTADNVVVLETVYVTSGATGSPVTDGLGTGDGVVLNDGVQIAVTWQRDHRGEPFELRARSDGRPIELRPGRTWLELVPAGQSPFGT